VKGTSEVTMVICQVVAAIMFLLGIYCLYLAFSAIQFSRFPSSEAYTEGIYYLLFAIALFLFAVLIQVSAYISWKTGKDTLTQIAQDTSSTRTMVNKIGKIIQQDHGNKI
jgi:hypothetical protein